jgi:hypothetical protein
MHIERSVSYPPYNPGHVSVASRIATIARLIYEHVKALFNMLLSREDELTSTNQLTHSQMVTYANVFNSDASNTTWVITPNNCDISFLGAANSTWSVFDSNKLEKSYAYKVLESRINNSTNRLELPEGKNCISIVVNLGNKHWTSIQIHLSTQTIYYLDSAGQSTFANVNYNAIIDNYLAGLKACLEHYIPGRVFTLARGQHSPSIVESREQFDGWNCGVFVFYYASLAKDVANAHFQRPFNEVQAHVLSRRAHILSCARE